MKRGAEEATEDQTKRTKPEENEAPPPDYPSDWTCTKCNDINFARRQVCRKCLEPRDGASPAAPAPESLFFKTGDWNCACGEHNFASRTTCRKCGSTKNVSSVTPVTRVAGEPDSHFKSGDWMCPNCNDHNFATRSVCRQCMAQKPPTTEQKGAAVVTHGTGGEFTSTTFGGYGGGGGPGGYGFEGSQAPYHPYGAAPRYLPSPPPYPSSNPPPSEPWSCYKCNTLNNPIWESCPNCAAPRDRSKTDGQNWKNGDWKCPRCGEHCFASRSTCRVCQFSNAGDVDPLLSNPGNWKPGDWTCGCGDHNFASRSACRKCNKPRPGGASAPVGVGGFGGSGFKVGDWNCAKCHDHNFASRTSCRKCGAGKP